jgi:K+-sensing histidine kinase KdpD
LVTSQLDQYFQLQGIQSQNFDSLKRSILQLITPDFRLPLSAVQEYSNTLVSGLENVRSDKELKRSLRGIQDGSVRLTNLVEDFISLAEIKTGEAETAYALREQPIHNPGNFLCEVSQSSQYINSRADVTVRCDAGGDLTLPPIYGDADSLRNGFRRLLEVIVKLCRGEEHHELAISTSLADDEICCQLTLPPTISSQELEQFAFILAKNDLDPLNITKYAPSLTIARSYIALNNGRIQMPSSYQIRICFPVYTQAITS